MVSCSSYLRGVRSVRQVELPPQDGGVGQVLLPEDVGEAGGAEVPPQLVLLGVREHGHVVQLEAGGREVLQDGLGKRI